MPAFKLLQMELMCYRWVRLIAPRRSGAELHTVLSALAAVRGWWKPDVLAFGGSKKYPFLDSR